MNVTEKAVLYSRSRFSCELSEIRAAKPDGARLLREAPAAFRRLCVETDRRYKPGRTKRQPPSGGCVLKLIWNMGFLSFTYQPPSGGCVLKPDGHVARPWRVSPAAFRRLCVETALWAKLDALDGPAAFRRLCVETCIESC